MWTGNIQNDMSWMIKKPELEIAFAFLRRENLREMKEGWYELEEGVRASVQRYTTKPSEQLFFENKLVIPKKP